MYEINARPTSWHTPNSFASRLSFVCITHFTVLGINSTTCYRSATVAAIEYLYTTEPRKTNSMIILMGPDLNIFHCTSIVGWCCWTCHLHSLHRFAYKFKRQRKKQTNTEINTYVNDLEFELTALFLWLPGKKKEKYVSINEFVWIWRNAKNIKW